MTDNKYDRFNYSFPAKNARLLFSDKDEFFIGRTDIKTKIVNHLRSTKHGRGCYLVGGYRGVGKTSTIRKSLNKYGEEDQSFFKVLSPGNHLVSIFINLGDGSVTSKRDILIELAVHLEAYLIKNIFGYRFFYTKLMFSALIPAFSITLLALHVVGFSTVKIPFDLAVVDPDISNLIWSALASFLSVIFFCTVRSRRKASVLLKSLDDLISSCHDVTTRSTSVSVGGGVTGYVSKILSSKKTERPPISNNVLQFRIVDILNVIKKESLSFGFFSVRKKYADVIFVFDELDKLESAKNELEFEPTKENAQELILTELKGFLSTALARFIFISDRALLDRFYSESVTKNSLYDGIFDDVFYIKSFLTDHSHGHTPALHKMTSSYLMAVLSRDQYESNSKKGQNESEADNIREYLQGCSPEENDMDNKTYILHRFIEYLTIYSWGIPRRLNSLIKNHIKMDPQGNYSLSFKGKDIKWILFASKIYQAVDHSQSNYLARSDDKLIISTIVGIHEIMRFHSLPFSRQYFDRSEEGINAHWEPNLHSAINGILKDVFNYTLRRINNGIFDYRFHSEIQESIVEITRLHGAEASSFIFGPDTTGKALNYYLFRLKRIQEEGAGSAQSLQSLAVTYSILGDICFWERSFDKAYTYYSHSAATLKIILRSPSNDSTRKEGLPSFSSQFLLCRVLLKHGLAEELRENYNLAMRLYRGAAEIAKEYLGVEDKHRLIEDALEVYWKNSGKKLDYREALVISMLAIDALSLKMGRKGRYDVTDSLPNLEEYYFNEKVSPSSVIGCLPSERNKNTNTSRYLELSDRVDFNSDMLQKALLVRLISNDSNFVIARLSPLMLYACHWKKEGQFQINYSECMLICLWCQAFITQTVEAEFKSTDEEGKRKFILDTILRIDKIDTESWDVDFASPSEMGIADAVHFLFIAAIRLKELGFRVRASYLFMHISSVFTFFVDTASLMGDQAAKDSSISRPPIGNSVGGGQSFSFIGEVKSKMYKCAITVDSGDFASRRREWLYRAGIRIAAMSGGNDRAGNNCFDKHYTSHLVQNLVSTKPKRKICIIAMYDLLAFWHRSPIEINSMMTDLWCEFSSAKYFGSATWNMNTRKKNKVIAGGGAVDKSNVNNVFVWGRLKSSAIKTYGFVKYILLGGGEKSTTEELNNFLEKDISSLINSPRNCAVFFWIKGRGITEKSNLNLGGDGDEGFRMDLRNAFASYCIALTNIEICKNNGFPISFPVKAMIYYGIWKVLLISERSTGDSITKNNGETRPNIFCRIKNVLLAGKRGSGKRGKGGDMAKHDNNSCSNVFNDDFKRSLTNIYRVPRTIFDIDSAANLVTSEFTEISNFRNRDSKSYREMLDARHFLFDDFDDPIFKIDWVNLKLLSTIAPIYLKEVNEAMDKRKKEGGAITL